MTSACGTCLQQMEHMKIQESVYAPYLLQATIDMFCLLNPSSGTPWRYQPGEKKYGTFVVHTLIV